MKKAIKDIRYYPLKQLLILLLTAIMNPAAAQNIKTVTLLRQQNIYLDAYSKSVTGGQSRAVVKIAVPQNTLHWYYSFTTSIGEQEAAALNCAAWIKAGLAGKSDIALSQVKVPDGAAAVCVYVIRPDYTAAFLERKDFHYYRELSLENSRQGLQAVEHRYGDSVYLAFRNQDPLQGVTVAFEVVAVIAESDPAADSAGKYATLAWNAYTEDNLNKSLELNKKALSYKPSFFIARINIALTHLAQGSGEALDEYTATMAIAKDQRDPKPILNRAVQNVRNLKRQNPALKNIDAIEALLLTEFRKY